MKQKIEEPLISSGNILQKVRNTDLVDGTFHLPEGITHIGNHAFYMCDELTHITLAEGITHIGNCAFANCINLASLILPQRLTYIGENAFLSCKLTQITLPDKITNIGLSAFQGCLHLTGIILPNEIKYIGYSLFGYCRSLTRIVLPKNLLRIGYGAFSNCINLTHVFMSEDVFNIESDAFHNCPRLQYIVILGVNKDKLEHIRSLLPEELKNKVVAQCQDFLVKWQFFTKQALKEELPGDVAYVIYNQALGFFNPEVESALKIKNETLDLNTLTDFLP